jgi:hypothetical protein
MRVHVADANGRRASKPCAGNEVLHRCGDLGRGKTCCLTCRNMHNRSAVDHAGPVEVLPACGFVRPPHSNGSSHRISPFFVSRALSRPTKQQPSMSSAARRAASRFSRRSFAPHPSSATWPLSVFRAHFHNRRCESAVSSLHVVRQGKCYLALQSCASQSREAQEHHLALGSGSYPMIEITDTTLLRYPMATGSCVDTLLCVDYLRSKTLLANGLLTRSVNNLLQQSQQFSFVRCYPPNRSLSTLAPPR